MANSVNGITLNYNKNEKTKSVLNSFRIVKGYAGKTSISALSKDLIMQFPVIMSAGIDTDNAVVIAKALERMFASMFLAVWSADATMTMKDYSMNGVRDFVKQYHNNDDIPDVITYTGDILALTDTLLGNEAAFTVTSSTECLPANEAAKLWESTESELALESLNEMYLPATKAQKQIASITAALEDIGDIDSDTIKAFAHKSQNGSIDPYAGKPGRDTKSSRNVSYKEISYPKTGSSASFKNIDSKLSSLEPTLIDVTFLVTGPGAGGTMINKGSDDKTTTRPYSVREQHAVVGVKTMIRLVPSQYMVPNVIASIQDQSLAFKFIKYTKGEMKIGRDMILGISRMKQDARANNQADMWFAALRKRKRAAKTFKFSNTGINPFATLVLTTDEVEQVKASTGYDVMDKTTTKLLMDNLFLLGLVVVNINTGIVYSIFDGNENYSSTTLKALKTTADKKDPIDMMHDLRIMMGRM